MALMKKNLPPNAGDPHLPGSRRGGVQQLQGGCGFDPWVRKILLEEDMATHPSILSWRIPWTGEPGGLQSMGSQRVGHN